MWLKIYVDNNIVSMFDASFYSRIYLDGTCLYGTLREARREAVRACDGGWSSDVIHTDYKLFEFASLECALKAMEKISLQTGGPSV
jgi:hypothetical protein